MKNYSKIRELVKTADALEAEARKMSGQSRSDRMSEARGYRVKALWLAGRITAEQYGEYLSGK
jgi:hypothetical protein